MKKLAKIFDEEKGLVEVALEADLDNEWLLAHGFTPMDVDENPLKGQYYLEGRRPEEVKTIQEQITELEDSITKRNLRCAMLGDEVALAKIRQVEEQIDELRKQL